MDIMSADAAQTAGRVIGVIGVVLGAAYGFVMQHKKKVADTQAGVAASVAEKSVADAQSMAYNTVTDRLKQLEMDVNNMRKELATERKYNRRLDLHNRKLEIYIIKLVAMLKASNIDVPPMETLPDLDINDDDAATT